MVVSRYRTGGSNLKDIREFFNSRPGVISNRVANELENIGSFAVETIKDVIDRSVTPTGAKAMAAGERSTAGRVRGAGERAADHRQGGKSMIDSVSYKVNRNIPKTPTSRSKNNLTLRYGWLSGTPGYVWWQENGSASGIKGMGALAEADLFTESLLKRYLI
jgi:hypothetical protein